MKRVCQAHKTYQLFFFIKTVCKGTNKNGVDNAKSGILSKGKFFFSFSCRYYEKAVPLHPISDCGIGVIGSRVRLRI